MSWDLGIHAPVGLLPVLFFLAGLLYFDSYKLVSIRRVLLAIGLGGVLVVPGYFINGAFLDILDVEYVAYARYGSPLIEELLKGVVIIVLMRQNRIGFLVDAAIFGFAVGAGFAVVENLYYLQSLDHARMGTWIIRGFGTAIMHGGATAIFAISGHALMEQRNRMGHIVLLPGLLVASAVHSIFNHFFFSPILTTMVVLALLPLLVVVVFQQSEKSVARWLNVGFDADTELLHLINSGGFSTSKVGLYLHSLREKFRGEVVADLLCYLQLHVELALRAKGLLMMRESGFENVIGEETRAKLEELKFLEKSIGPTGKLAIKPFLQMSRQDLWQFYMLSK
ncbi:MAG: PrsW family intramembrane metalloprotease [Woeseia sp.]